MSLELLKERAKQEHPTFVGFYDLSDPLIRAYAIKGTPCFATYSSKDSECALCPLANDCQKTKADNDEVKAKQKAYKEEHKEELEQEKVKKEFLKKIPNLGKYRKVDAVQKEIKSPLSDNLISVGSPACWIEGFGIITLDEARILGLAL